MLYSMGMPKHIAIFLFCYFKNTQESQYMFGLKMFIFIYILLAVDSLWIAKNGNIEEITKPENQTKLKDNFGTPWI